MTVTALVLGPIVVGLLLYALPRTATTAARTVAAVVAALTFIAPLVDPNAPDAAVRWLSRPFSASFHPLKPTST